MKCASLRILRFQQLEASTVMLLARIKRIIPIEYFLSIRMGPDFALSASSGATIIVNKFLFY